MSGNKPSVIIVDDEDEVRNLLKEAFELNGYKVFMAANGLKLIAMLRVEEIDVVLLDINMPWLSGTDICKSIKKDPNLRHIKVIYLSGLIKDKEECYQTGCDGIIEKPFNIIDVIKTVETLYNQ